MDYLKDNHWPRRTKDNHDLNVAACRLIMNLIPGLETTVVFESVSIILNSHVLLLIIKIKIISLQMINLFKGYFPGL